MMPYGLFSSREPGGDAFHDWTRGPAAGQCYRFFMPTQKPGRIVHGLASHWTSWAHAFANLARVLERDECRQAGFDQLAWLMGNNPLGASAVTGVGCRNVVPYSRFQGGPGRVLQRLLREREGRGAVRPGRRHGLGHGGVLDGPPRQCPAGPCRAGPVGGLLTRPVWGTGGSAALLKARASRVGSRRTEPVRIGARGGRSQSFAWRISRLAIHVRQSFAHAGACRVTRFAGTEGWGKPDFR